MSVFKSDEEPLEKRVKLLEKKVREIEKMLGKTPTKESDKIVNEEDDEICVIS